MEKIRSVFSYKDSKFLVYADSDKSVKQAECEIIKQRTAIEKFIVHCPEFLSSLKPLAQIPENSPQVVKEMHEASVLSGVGPMAGVAGAIAEKACRKMSKSSGFCIVNNGGDIYAVADKPFTVSLYCGSSFGKKHPSFVFVPEDTPVAVCSSSSLMGHSLSFGKCSLATVLSNKGAVADCFATRICNSVRKIADLDKLSSIVNGQVSGAVAVKGKKIAFCGKIPQISFTDCKKAAENVVHF